MVGDDRECGLRLRPKSSRWGFGLKAVEKLNVNEGSIDVE